MAKRIEGRIRLLSALHHGGDEKTGSTPMLRAVTVIGNGRRVRVPYISGNAIRGVIRRLLVRDLIDLCGIQELPKKAVHILASGGVLELGESTGRIDLDMKTRLRDTIPLIRLLGCSIGNQIISGQLIVGHAVPIAQETVGVMLPELEGEFLPIRELIGQEFITRRDEVREREEDDQAVQMKVDFEVLLPGTILWHYFQVNEKDGMAIATIGRAIKLWREKPFIGARSASGFGEIDPQYQEIPDDTPYVEHMTANTETIKDLIKEIA